MKNKFKKISCKCKNCNKPFSAYTETDLCKQCEEKKRFYDAGITIRERAIRNGLDVIDQSIEKHRAEVMLRRK